MTANPETPISPHDALVTRIRGEYSEMPGLRLTVAQACRLWQMDLDTCDRVLRTLLEEHFLARTPDGAFVTWSTGERLRTAKAALPSHAVRQSA